MNTPKFSSLWASVSGPSSRAVVTLVGIAAAGLGTAGCGNVQSDRIETICQCMNCGDRERQEVELIVQSEYDIADTYSCVDALEPYWQCQLDQYDCRDNNYTDNNDACDAELQQYQQCTEGRSTRRPGPYF